MDEQIMKLLEFDYSIDEIEGFLETGKIIGSFENQEKSYIDYHDKCDEHSIKTIPGIWIKCQECSPTK